MTVGVVDAAFASLRIVTAGRMEVGVVGRVFAVFAVLVST